MPISVCVATVRPTTLPATIASIRRQTWSDWELFVVGQGENGTLRTATEAAAEGDDRVHYIHLAQRGLSLARNTGLHAATGDIIAMTDDDCEAHPDWLASLAECFAAEPEVGLVGGSLLAAPPTRPGPSKCLSLVPGEVLYDPVATRYQPPEEFEWYGANFALRRSAVERVGLFDEWLGVGSPFLSAEDVDYKHRLEAAGVTMRSTPRAVVSHTHGRRYGFRTLIRYWHQSATGAGAVAAKRTLLGDRRGAAWLRSTVREESLGWLRRCDHPRSMGRPHICRGPRRPRPDRLPAHLVRLQAFVRAYYRCLHGFRVDPTRGVLYPATSASRAGRAGQQGADLHLTR